MREETITLKRVEKKYRLLQALHEEYKKCERRGMAAEVGTMKDWLAAGFRSLLAVTGLDLVCPEDIDNVGLVMMLADNIVRYTQEGPGELEKYATAGSEYLQLRRAGK